MTTKQKILAKIREQVSNVDPLNWTDEDVRMIAREFNWAEKGVSMRLAHHRESQRLAEEDPTGLIPGGGHTNSTFWASFCSTPEDRFKNFFLFMEPETNPEFAGK